MTEFINIINNFGFPIAVTVYLLYRFEKKIEFLTKSIDQIKEVIIQKL
ncbi:YvrJ family protein [Bacillus sp. OAE603]